MKVSELTMTCGECPTQWEGQLEDGRAIYIRYRWGELGVAVAATHDEALDVFGGFSVDGWYFEPCDCNGDGNGFCTLADVAEAVPDVDFSAAMHREG